jgi:hypothetical protein
MPPTAFNPRIYFSMVYNRSAGGEQVLRGGGLKNVD